MNRFMIVILLGFEFVINYTGGLPAQDDLAAGIWKVIIVENGQEDKNVTKWLAIGTNDDNKTLLIMDFADIANPLKGKLDGNRAEFELFFEGDNVVNLPGEFTVDSKGVVELKGSFTSEGKKFSVSGARLPTVWACSNHDDPVHTAQSEEEMRKSTKEHHCVGWRSLKSSKISEVLAKLMEDSRRE